MNISNRFSIFCLSLFVMVASCYGTYSAPYQIQIRLFDNYNTNFNTANFPVCNGAIIHPYFCVTTADCLHSHILSQDLSRVLPASSIYVVGGNFTSGALNVRYASQIIIHHNFDAATLKNDIALIRLETPFNLQNTSDLQWVDLPTNETKYRNCFYCLNNASSPQNAYPFTAPKPTSVISNLYCKRNDSYLTEISTIDICSFYPFDHIFMCQVPVSQLKLSNDRGTPLLCDNKLVGLLSAIIPPIDDTNSTAACPKTLQTNAYYTKMEDYCSWIHSVIGVTTPPATADGKPVPIIPLSSPFEAPATATTTTATTVIAPPKRGAAPNMCSSSVAAITMGFVTWLFVYRFVAK